MARLGKQTRPDPKATGTAFRKAGKHKREEDSNGNKQAAVSKRQRAVPNPKDKKGAESAQPGPKKPNPSKPFKGDKIAKKPQAPKSKPEAAKPLKPALKSSQPVQPPPLPASVPPAKPRAAKVSRPTTSSSISNEASPKRAMRIVAGSYERFLYGLAAFMRVDETGNYVCVIEPQFVFPAHVSSIRSVACAGNDAKWLCTGGTDETIKVWDLRRRKEVGALIGHEGTITSLSFPSRTFMLSAGEDGLLNLYRARDWSLLRTLRGHTGRINSASAHPSGRIALSVGVDRMIRMWDLMRGTGAASVKIGIAADRILWDTLGKRFAVLAGRQVMVFATDMTKLTEIEQSKRLHDISFTRVQVREADHELLLVAEEAGVVHVYDLDDLQQPAEEDPEAVGPPRELGRLVGHTNRYVFPSHLSVRSAEVVHVAAEDDTVFVLAVTISSDGFIRIFNLTPVTSHDEQVDLESIAHYDTKRSRLTCLSAVGFDPDASGALGAEEDAEDPEGLGSDLEALTEGEDEEDEEGVEEDDAGAEDSDEELARLEEEVRRAREAGVVIDEDGGVVLEGEDDEDEDNEDGDEDEDGEDDEEEEGELEDEEEEEEA